MVAGGKFATWDIVARKVLTSAQMSLTLESWTLANWWFTRRRLGALQRVLHAQVRADVQGT